ncbi:spore coat protein (inner coat) [Bacillus spizizenii str. W23]|uniref:Spore coat protein (Inner coat) n=1 Tax=Bacillus spizizenii (strain ATCC 23059 / NRRL B-14472 / W23) TaxID=655816 RepID=E0U0D7_BACSH|nr:spore coat protein (inner coat) [Bacillus spizizenii str. W23]EFG91441.1 hypothetical protein BSU6633_16097 [Bacillus spizizenii ATCC 6633 = JCM 2499]
MELQLFPIFVMILSFLKQKNGELDCPHFGKTAFNIRILRRILRHILRRNRTKGSKAGVGAGNSKADVDKTDRTVLGNNKADKMAVSGANNKAVFHHKV